MKTSSAKAKGAQSMLGSKVGFSFKKSTNNHKWNLQMWFRLHGRTLSFSLVLPYYHKAPIPNFRVKYTTQKKSFGYQICITPRFLMQESK